MDFDLQLSPHFSNDLDRILFYYLNTLYAEAAAKNLINQVDKTINIIRNDPFLFPRYHAKQIADRGYRYAVIGNYLLFYLIREKENRVIIARMLYGRSNIIDIL